MAKPLLDHWRVAGNVDCGIIRLISENMLPLLISANVCTKERSFEAQISVHPKTSECDTQFVF